MSFTPNRVKLNNKLKTSVILAAMFGIFEIVLSVFFVVTLSAEVLFPQTTLAAQGVSKILSYQGRLTDSNGVPVANNTYCFRFSIYDAVSGGTKLWPSATPSNSTTTVSSGVFNIGIGDVSVGGNSLSSYYFSSNDTQYLNIDVNTTPSTCAGTWETLTPRQRIDAVAFARVAEDVYGPAMYTSTTKVQIGTGVGGSAPINLVLDTKNVSDTIGGTCSPNGAVWFNSSNKTALVCNNGAIMYFGATSTISGIKEQAASTPIVSGTVNFSGSNNITISQTGNTLQFSVPSQSVQTQNVQALGVSNIAQTFTSGTVQFSAGNLISLSTGAQAIIISNVLSSSATALDVAAVSNAGTLSSRFALADHAHRGIGAIIANAANGTNSFYGNLSLAAGNNITLSTGAGVISIHAGAGGGGIAGIAVNALTTYTSGTVVISAGANITLGTAGQTITIAAPAGGGGGGFRQGFVGLPVQSVTSVTFLAPNTTHGTVFVQPFDIAGSISIKTLGFMLDRSTGTTLAQTIQAGIYSLNGATLSLISSTSNNYSLSTTAQWGGTARRFDLTGLSALQLTPGRYWLAMRLIVTSGQPRIWGSALASQSIYSSVVSPGTNSSVAQTLHLLQPGLGTFSSAGIPVAMNITAVSGQAATGFHQQPWFIITEIP